MNSTTLPSRAYGAEPQAVAQALRDLSTAAATFATALLAAMRPRPTSTVSPTPTEEAARVRDLASRCQRSDPGFAADLFAAADRYERAHEL